MYLSASTLRKEKGVQLLASHLRQTHKIIHFQCFSFFFMNIIAEIHPTNISQRGLDDEVTSIQKHGTLQINDSYHLHCPLGAC